MCSKYPVVIISVECSVSVSVSVSSIYLHHHAHSGCYAATEPALASRPQTAAAQRRSQVALVRARFGPDSRRAIAQLPTSQRRAAAGRGANPSLERPKDGRTLARWSTSGVTACVVCRRHPLPRASSACYLAQLPPLAGRAALSSGDVPDCGRRRVAPLQQGSGPSCWGGGSGTGAAGAPCYTELK